jgi:branched-chain amino acid transport system substrate-binding protein
MRRVLLVIASTSLLAGAGAGATPADPGVTPTSILIGGTVPLSGEAAAIGSVGPGAKAYFDYVNAHGGVYGRKVVYRYYDDGYDPARTVQLTRQLVEQDHVFAIFNSIGTANNLAIRDYLNAMKVPQLFVGDGSDAIGGSPRAYPWTMGFLPSYRGEGAVYGRDLIKRSPKAKIAVLFENTVRTEMTRGLSRAIADKGPKIVATQSYDYTASDVSSQIAQLKASGANTLMLLAAPKFMIQAVVAAHKLGWKPQLYIASVSAEPTIMGIASATAPELTKGALSIAFVKNPNDPIWASDPALALYLRIMKAYDPAGKPSDVYNWYGMTVAWTMVETLKLAGKNPTRPSLLRAATRLNLRGNPFLLPGIVIRTTPTRYFPLAQVYLYRWNNKQWVRSSGLLPAS